MKPMVNLQVDKLIKYCSNNKISNEELLERIKLLNRDSNSIIHNVFKYRKFNDDFVDRITIYDDNTIRFCYDEFLIKLFKYLNIDVKPNSLSEEEIDKLLLERLNVLRSIKHAPELFREFPTIKEDYFKGIEYLDNNKDDKYYYQCALYRSLPKYMERQKELYTRFVLRRSDYEEEIKLSSLNEFFKEYFDMDKVMIYIVNNYINVCNYIDDKELIKEYLELINNYLDSTYDKSVEIEVEDGKRINIDVIKERLLQVKAKLSPEISIVDWELVPPGKGRVIKGNSNKRKIIISKDELERLRAKGQEKRVFYDNSGAQAKVFGTQINEMYVAYIYENGEVILDTIYDDSNPRTAIGNAIYNIKARDFENVSCLNKKELSKHPNVTKINHSKKWIDRVEEIINREASEEEKEDVKRLIKRLNNK